MPAGVFCLLIAMGMQFPRPQARADDRGMVDQSWISGQVTTQSRETLPLATISVQSRADASRADQRGTAIGWRGAATRVKIDGSFRVAVPGGSTFEVCASLPGHDRQCRTIDVNANDLEVVNFSF